MEKRLYRSKKNTVIAGVCGGFAEYFNIDPTIVRILTVALGVVSFGTAVVAYVLAAIIIPMGHAGASHGSFNDAGHQNTSGTTYTMDEELRDLNAKAEEWKTTPKYDSDKSRNVIGFGLVAIGAMFLLKQLIPSFDSRLFWPMVIIGIGALILYRGGRRQV